MLVVDNALCLQASATLLVGLNYNLSKVSGSCGLHLARCVELPLEGLEAGSWCQLWGPQEGCVGYHHSRR